METNCFPRILVISNTSIFGNSQTAITLRNIFANWPNKQLAQMYTENLSNDHAQCYSYQLPLNHQPLALLAKAGFFKKVNDGMKTDRSSASTTARPSLKGRFRQWLFSLTDRSPIVLLPRDYRAIAEFRPDVVYTMGSSVTQMKLAVKVASRLHIPIIPHFMDNWPEAIQWQDNRLLIGYRRVLDRWLARMYKHTKCALTIGDEMAEYYEAKTGICHLPLRNAVDVDAFFCQPLGRSDRIEFLYAGGLHLGRSDTLYEIAKRLQTVSNEVNACCIMKIYTGSNQPADVDKLSEMPGVSVCGAVDHSLVVQLFREADVLVLAEPLSPDPTTAQFTKYSISTKTAEYLSSGRPIIYVGNHDNALARYLIVNKAGIVVGSLDDLTQGMLDATDAEQTEILRKNALLLARRNHNITDINKTLLYAVRKSRE